MRTGYQTGNMAVLQQEKSIGPKIIFIEKEIENLTRHPIQRKSFYCKFFTNGLLVIKEKADVWVVVAQLVLIGCFPTSR